MRAAIPLYGSRVSPRFPFAEQTLIVELRNGRVAGRKIVETGRLPDAERLEQLSDLAIDVFVCGAVDPVFMAEAGSLGIQVIPDVAGEQDEVLDLLARGRLLPGHGTYAGSTPEESTQEIDCVACLERVCLHGKPCPGLIRDLHGTPAKTDQIQMLDVATDIAWETERRLCRVAEFVHFCHEMRFEHVGVAFCVELSRETQILTHLLRRYEWPGNIRELENAIEHAFVICQGEESEPQHLPDRILNATREGNGPATRPLNTSPESVIRECLHRNDGDRAKTARELGMHRTTLWRKMRQYGIA